MSHWHLNSDYFFTASLLPFVILQNELNKANGISKELTKKTEEKITAKFNPQMASFKPRR